jgi:hypothetical protein
MRPEAKRLRTLRRRRDYLVTLLEDAGNPVTRQRDHLLAEVNALTWALQELEDIRPELHSHTIKVVKDMLVHRLRAEGVDESVVEMVRDSCNRINRRIPADARPFALARELAERED